MQYPKVRTSRLRASEPLRALVRQVDLQPHHLIAPLFVHAAPDRQRPIPSMPGQFQWSVDGAAEFAQQLWAAGVQAVLLFGLPAYKDAQGSESWQPDGVVQRALRRIRDAVADIVLIADACFCEYTDHGHCGVLRERRGRLEIDHDATRNNLARQAASYAAAGADLVAPSGMIDAGVAAVRAGLDEAGFPEVAVMAYAAKYASAFYGPFRDAAGGAPSFGDRRGHQMDPANADEALREVDLDVQEGADIVLVKPALAYLDVLHRVKQRFLLPTAAYNVSGEYAMVKAASAHGWIDEHAAVLEILTSIRRAGADMIVTYHALDAANWLKD